MSHLCYLFTYWWTPIVSIPWLLPTMLQWTVGVQIFLLNPIFTSFGHIPRSRISRSSCSPSFNFLRKLHTVFRGGCTNFHLANSEVPFSPCPCQRLSSLGSLTIATLTGVKWAWIPMLECRLLRTHKMSSKSAESLNQEGKTLPKENQFSHMLWPQEKELLPFYWLHFTTAGSEKPATIEF